MTEPVRVVLVDDHSMFRSGVRAELAADAGVEIVGEAGGVSEAIAVIARTRPDVVVMDAMLPGLDSVEATRRMFAGTGAAVMLLTACEDADRSFAALRAGASGLLLKDTGPAELLRAVEAVARGEAPLPARPPLAA